MTYSLRVREDGQTEVLEHSAVVIGTFVHAEHARHFYDWMAGAHLTVRKAPEPEIELVLPAEDPPSANVAPRPTPGGAPGLTIPRLSVPAPAARTSRPSDTPEQPNAQAERDSAVSSAVEVGENAPEGPPAAHVPALVEKPRQAVTMCADLPTEVMAPAFERLERGERLQAVAADLGVPWPSLRGAYAGYKSRRQREISRAGMSTCSLCSKEFMPSVTSPDTCARCTRTMER